MRLRQHGISDHCQDTGCPYKPEITSRIAAFVLHIAILTRKIEKPLFHNPHSPLFREHTT
jgi:hypothetical protein